MNRPKTVLTTLALLATLASCKSRDGSSSSVVEPPRVTIPSAKPSVAAPIPSVPATATSSATAEPRNAQAPRPGKCVLPIAEFCRHETCPTRGGREKELRSLIARYKKSDSGCPRIATLGRCGRLYVVQEADMYTSATTYFDETGRLVAAERTSDTNGFCKGSFEARYGDIPACTPSVTEDLCAGVARRDDGL